MPTTLSPESGPLKSVRRRRATRAGLAAVAAGTLLCCLPSFAQAAPPTAGGSGVGDDYFPNYGNSGYDVSRYKIDVDYQPAGDLLKGHTTITAKATQDLRSFNLDFVLKASKVTVNGKPAKINQDDPHELVVRPNAPVKKGQTMKIDVEYVGVPSAVTVDGISPWVKTPDGAVAVGQPEIAAWWYPSNDHPQDKALFDIILHVPSGVEAISNGNIVSKKLTPKGDTWHWRETKPMVTYLAFMAVGQYEVTEGTTSKGLPWLNAVGTSNSPELARAKQDLARTPEVIDFLSKQFGPYPFDSAGGVAPDADFGFALENQTRSVYTKGFWRRGQNMSVVVHENAHQWYGDSAAVHEWNDIWVNEGFASYAEWLWSEDQGTGTGQQLLEEMYNGTPADNEFWQLTIGDPGADKVFDGPVYDRGAMSLQALRNRIGSPAFWQVVRTWHDQHEGKNGSVEEFMALAEQLSGEDLDGFFRAWLFSPTKPAATADNGLDLAAAAASQVDAEGKKVTPAPTQKVAAAKQQIDQAHTELHQD